MVTSSLGPYELAPGSSWPPGPDGAVEGTAPDGGRVVLRRSTPALVAAASSSPHPHLLRPVDVLVDDEGALVVVSDDVGGERLDRWARRRGTMSAGEAVTVLLPVLSAVAHLARRGTTLGSIGLDDVVLDDRGAPVLVGGRTTPPGATPPGTATEGAQALVEAVARELSPRDGARLRGPEGAGVCLDELVERVHDLAPAVPLPTVVPSTGVEEAGVAWRPPPDGPPRSGWTSVLPESALLDGVADWWEAVAAVPIVDRLRAVRPRFWVLAGLVAVSLVVGAAVVPRSSRSDVSRSDTARPVATSPADALASPAVSPPTPVTVVPVPDRAPDDPVSTEEAAVRGDDAVAAAAVLLRARVACLREPSTSCLAAVDQAGSPVASADSRMVDDLASAGDLVLPTVVESEVQRLGETVLLACRTADDEPASVLVVRTEAGWRLREVLRR
jgi:hypothetical protein